MSFMVLLQIAVATQLCACEYATKFEDPTCMSIFYARVCRSARTVTMAKNRCSGIGSNEFVWLRPKFRCRNARTSDTEGTKVNYPDSHSDLF
jgi:hypothetical protein